MAARPARRIPHVPASRLATKDALLLSVVAVLWGFNFVPIRLALDEFPPFALAAVRFFLAAVPMVFFVRRPNIGLGALVAYGLAIGVGQFGLLFLAIHLGMAAGLASLLMQLQVFFTVALTAVFLGDRVGTHHIAGGCLAVLGLSVLGAQEFSHGARVTTVGLLLVVASSFSWALGNVMAKAAGRGGGLDMFALVVWSSLVPPLPLAAISYLLEGGTAPLQAIRAAGPLAWACVLFIAYGATLFGFSTWNRMLHKHPASTVTPFALIIPVAGLASARLLLDEPLTWLEFVAAVVILLGLAVAMFGDASRRRPTVRVTPPA